ncbi:hypothetical protein ACWD4J_35780 [Streptomyces sp. NPDC002577]
MADWSGKPVTRFDRRTGQTANVNMGTLVDNIAWNAGHTKALVGGQTDTIEQGFACTGAPAVNCDIHFAVDELDRRRWRRDRSPGPPSWARRRYRPSP